MGITDSDVGRERVRRPDWYEQARRATENAGDKGPN